MIRNLVEDADNEGHVGLMEYYDVGLLRDALYANNNNNNNNTPVGKILGPSSCPVL
jgi:hypothetical protein